MPSRVEPGCSPPSALRSSARRDAGLRPVSSRDGAVWPSRGEDWDWLWVCAEALPGDCWPVLLPLLPPPLSDVAAWPEGAAACTARAKSGSALVIATLRPLSP